VRNMHRSRIAVVLIDHPEESYEPAAAFWAGAQGATRSTNDDPAYESLDRLPGGLVFCVVPVWTDQDDFARHATTWPAP